MKRDEPESPGIREAAITAALIGLVAVLLSIIGFPFHRTLSTEIPSDQTLSVSSETRQ
jgi:hypothetical protein